MLDTTHMGWAAKAEALSTLAAEGANAPPVRAWADQLALAPLTAQQAAARVAAAVAASVEYRRERGDKFATAADVMARGADDCDGHAVLGAALAVASGHAARIVGVSRPGDRWPRHVRAEIGDGAAWYSADSTPARQVAPTIIHRPIATIASPPVAGLFSDGLGFLADALVLPLRPIAAGARWATDKVRTVANDPAFWVALGALVGCSIAGGPAAAMVCAHAVPIAKGAMAARAIDVDAWQNADSIAELGAEVDRQRRRDPRRFAEAEEVAQEVLTMIATSPAARMAADPQIAEDTIAYIQRHGRPETRAELARQMPVFARTPEARARVVLHVLASPSSPVRADAGRAFDAALAAAARRTPPARDLQVGRTADPQRTAQQRGQAAALASMSAGRCGGLRPYVKSWLQGQHPTAWAAVWCNASPAERRELQARAQIATGQAGALRPEVKAWLEGQYPATWASRWVEASQAQRALWLATIRGQVAAVQRQPRDLSAALLAAPRPPAPAVKSGGGAALGFAALLGLGAFKFFRG